MEEMTNKKVETPFATSYLVEGNEYSPRIEYYKKENGEREVRNIYPDCTYSAIVEIDKRAKGEIKGALTIKNQELWDVLRQLYCTKKYFDSRTYLEYYSSVQRKFEELRNCGALVDDAEDYFTKEGGHFTGADLILYGMITRFLESDETLENQNSFYCFLNDSEYAMINILDWFTPEYQEYFKNFIHISCVVAGSISPFVILISLLHFKYESCQTNDFKTYVMSGSIGLYKIGRSIDPQKREESLSCGNPDIKLLFYINYDVEKELHKKFEDKRVKGEWFELNEEDLDYIRKYKPEQH